MSSSTNCKSVSVNSVVRWLNSTLDPRRPDWDGVREQYVYRLKSQLGLNVVSLKRSHLSYIADGVIKNIFFDGGWFFVNKKDLSQYITIFERSRDTLVSKDMNPRDVARVLTLAKLKEAKAKGLLFGFRRWLKAVHLYDPTLVPLIDRYNRL